MAIRTGKYELLVIVRDDVPVLSFFRRSIYNQKTSLVTFRGE